MALPQFEVFDPQGKLIGVFEVRADAHKAIQQDIQAKAGGYRISDEKFRRAEAAEFDEAAKHSVSQNWRRTSTR
jgi:hypothetical protein